MQNWQVLFVKPRTEKKIAEYCRLYRIPHYLPLRTQTKKVQRRTVTTLIPLFPGYVFVKCNEQERLQLLKTNLLVRFLTPPRPMRLLRSLVMVRRALQANPTLEAAPPLTTGNLVRIISGPFKGIEGFVKHVSDSCKVVLNIEMIGQAIAVVAERDQLEKL